MSDKMREIFSISNFSTIKNLFREEEWEEMNETLTNYENSLTEDELSFDSPSEKCWEIVEEFLVTSFDQSPILDCISKDLKSKSKKRFPDYVYQSLALKIRDNKPYYDLYCSTISGKQRKQFDEILEVLSKGEEIPEGELFAKYNLDNSNTRFNLMLYGTAASLDGIRISTKNKTIKASMRVEEFHIQYNYFIQLVNDNLYKIEELNAASKLLPASIQNVLSHFYRYYLLYDKNWTNHFWGQFFHKIIFGDQRVAFLNYLRSKGDDSMVNVFCDELEDYCYSNKLPLPFDPYVIPCRFVPQSDMDMSHKDWFEKIPEVKYNGVYNKLYQNLGKLYDRLLKEKWIEKNKKNTFIYRFSGFGDTPFDLTHTINWLSGNNRDFAFLLLALYNHWDKENKKVISPHYKKMQAFFGIDGDKNIIAGLDQWTNNKTWTEIKGILEDCGFTELEPIKKERKQQKVEINTPKSRNCGVKWI